MRIVFFGTPKIAADVLRVIDRHHEVVAVVTQPDRPKGRSGRPVPSPVKEYALEKQIPLFQPEKASEEGFIEALRAFDADLFVVVAYGQILRQRLLDLPKHDCINLHASLLPKYRGAAPIQRAIMAGEKKTGVAVMSMVREMDAGDVYAMTELEIGPEETAQELSERMAVAGADLLCLVLEAIEQGSATRTPQDPAQVTFAPKIESEACEIDWKHPAEQVHNLIRGVSPDPGAWCFVSVGGEKKRLKIFRSSLREDLTGSPKEIIPLNKKEWAVACQNGAVVIHELQLEGKKKMPSQAFLQGISLSSLSLS